VRPADVGQRSEFDQSLTSLTKVDQNLTILTKPSKLSATHTHTHTTATDRLIKNSAWCSVCHTPVVLFTCAAAAGMQRQPTAANRMCYASTAASKSWHTAENHRLALSLLALVMPATWHASTQPRMCSTPTTRAHTAAQLYGKAYPTCTVRQKPWP
jgi:hypothetical protein